MWMLGTKLCCSEGAMQAPTAETYLQSQAFTNPLDM